ncbi:outer membrane protein assembly factor BamB family protein [Allorhodopirellula solitaria]|uniref:Outer membrane protein assembly factor BamB n=1 Tax=Allorhodopirellula solitaria TaxID=2527987 RepID=A0A5C5XQL1_9BACT|nr:PQQ-binding-like beta-propeller repeat protein [Allorhodopirellula solitaria]TWT65180.1 Outer membrane protein assembly factor BamB [Allorhodopirellula solitaria]
MQRRPPVSVLLFFTLLLFGWVGLSGVGSAEQPSEPAAGAWPRFLNRDFSGAAELTGDLGSVADLDWRAPTACRWSLPVGDGYGLGVIDHGAYFHFDAAGGRERLRKIDLRSGELLWSSTNTLSYRDLYGYETGPRCSPTIDGEQIFTVGVAGGLTARRVEDGEIQWRVETNERYHVVQNFFGAGSAPLVLGDAVIVMVGGSPEADQQIAPGRLDRVSPSGSLLVAFHRHTGEELWRCGDDLASYSNPRTIVLDGRDYVLIFAREFLHVVDPRQGESIGRFPFRSDLVESVNAMVPIVDGNRVLISECYQLGAALLEITLESGVADLKVVWRDESRNRRAHSMRSHLSTPVLLDGFVYGCSGRNSPDSDFRCVEFATGEVQWTALSRRRSTASRIGDLLLVLEERGELHLVRCTPDGFDEFANWPLDTAGSDRPAIRFPCWAAPIIAGDCFLVRGDQTVICLELPAHP